MQYRNHWNIQTTSEQMAQDKEALAIARELGIRLPTAQLLKNRGCTKYKSIPDDYRMSIDRECFRFKRLYALRSECERYNSRFKGTGQERLWVRNGNSAANLNTIAHITALAVALAAVESKSHHSYRSLKQLKRIG